MGRTPKPIDPKDAFIEHLRNYYGIDFKARSLGAWRAAMKKGFDTFSKEYASMRHETDIIDKALSKVFGDIPIDVNTGKPQTGRRMNQFFSAYFLTPKGGIENARNAGAKKAKDIGEFQAKQASEFLLSFLRSYRVRFGKGINKRSVADAAEKIHDLDDTVLRALGATGFKLGPKIPQRRFEKHYKTLDMPSIKEIKEGRSGPNMVGGVNIAGNAPNTFGQIETVLKEQDEMQQPAGERAASTFMRTHMNPSMTDPGAFEPRGMSFGGPLYYGFDFERERQRQLALIDIVHSAYPRYGPSLEMLKDANRKKGGIEELKKEFKPLKTKDDVSGEFRSSILENQLWVEKQVENKVKNDAKKLQLAQEMGLREKLRDEGVFPKDVVPGVVPPSLGSLQGETPDIKGRLDAGDSYYKQLQDKKKMKENEELFYRESTQPWTRFGTDESRTAFGKSLMGIGMSGDFSGGFGGMVKGFFKQEADRYIEGGKTPEEKSNRALGMGALAIAGGGAIKLAKMFFDIAKKGFEMLLDFAMKIYEIVDPFRLFFDPVEKVLNQFGGIIGSQMMPALKYMLDSMLTQDVIDNLKEMGVGFNDLFMVFGDLVTAMTAVPDGESESMFDKMTNAIVAFSELGAYVAAADKEDIAAFVYQMGLFFDDLTEFASDKENQENIAAFMSGIIQWGTTLIKLAQIFLPFIEASLPILALFENAMANSAVLYAIIQFFAGLADFYAEINRRESAGSKALGSIGGGSISFVDAMNAVSNLLRTFVSVMTSPNTSLAINAFGKLNTAINTMNSATLDRLAVIFASANGSASSGTAGGATAGGLEGLWNTIIGNKPIPTLDSQGSILRSGLAVVHAGEDVIKRELISDIVKSFTITQNFYAPNNAIMRNQMEDSMRRLLE